MGTLPRVQRGYGGTRIGARHPDGGAHERGFRRDLERRGTRQGDLDDRTPEGWQPARVPLSPRAVELLEKAWLFPGDRGGKLSGMASAMPLRRMKADVTVHGIRSGFRDRASECTAYAHEVGAGPSVGCLDAQARHPWNIQNS
jgi:integrase